MCKEVVFTNEEIAEIDAVVREVMSRWELPGELPAKPVILMVGGFQGAGKTSTLEFLKDEPGLIILSPDEIRHCLFSRGHTYSERFSKFVEEAGRQLLVKALDSGYTVAIDRLTTEARIDVVKSILAQPKYKNYTLITVYLHAPEEVLVQRVGGRPKLAGKYKGTVEELKASIKLHGQPNFALYDLVIDTSEVSPQAAVQQIREKIKVDTPSLTAF